MSNFFKNVFGSSSDDQPIPENSPIPMPPDAEAQLNMALADLDHDQPEVRAKAAIAIDNMAAYFRRPDLRQRVVPHLFNALTSTDFTTGMTALRTLARAPIDLSDDKLRADAIRYLSEVSHMDDEYIQGMAFEILSGIATQYREAAEIVMPRLIDTLNAKPGQDLLEEHNTAAEGRPATAQVLQSVHDAFKAEGDLRATAAHAIGEIGAHFGEVALPAVPSLIEAVQDPVHYWLSVMAAEALLKIDHPQVKALLEKLDLLDK